MQRVAATQYLRHCSQETFPIMTYRTTAPVIYNQMSKQMNISKMFAIKQ